MPVTAKGIEEMIDSALGGSIPSTPLRTVAIRKVAEKMRIRFEANRELPHAEGEINALIGNRDRLKEVVEIAMRDGFRK